MSGLFRPLLPPISWSVPLPWPSALAPEIGRRHLILGVRCLLDLIFFGDSHLLHQFEAGGSILPTSRCDRVHPFDRIIGVPSDQNVTRGQFQAIWSSEAYLCGIKI